MDFSEKIKQIDLIQQQIESHGELGTSLKHKINYKFRLEWNFHSNSMEGNTLTKEETRSIMIGNVTVGGKPIKDLLEIKGHDEVISTILKLGKGETRLSEARIKEIHRGIMHEEEAEKKKQIGEWKTEPNYVYNYKRERFDFAAPEDVPLLMHELLNKTNASIDAIRQGKKNAPHPLEVAANLHLGFVSIHPFYDGNGRTARIISNLLLISFGFPPFWIKAEERRVYSQYLGDIQVYDGDPELFYGFLADNLLRSQQLVLDAISGKNIEEAGELDKQIALLHGMLEGLGDEILTTKSHDSLDRVFDETIKPLITKISENISKVSPFFAATNYECVFDVNEPKRPISDYDWFRDIEHYWTKIDQGTGIRLVRDRKQFVFGVSLNKLKKLGLNAFDVYDEIKFYFYEHKYRIEFQEEKREYLYDYPFTEQEITEIAESFVKNIVIQIEEGVKRFNKNKQSP